MDATDWKGMWWWRQWVSAIRGIPPEAECCREDSDIRTFEGLPVKFFSCADGNANEQENTTEGSLSVYPHPCPPPWDGGLCKFLGKNKRRAPGRPGKAHGLLDKPSPAHTDPAHMRGPWTHMGPAPTSTLPTRASCSCTLTCLCLPCHAAPDGAPRGLAMTRSSPVSWEVQVPGEVQAEGGWGTIERGGLWMSLILTWILALVLSVPICASVSSSLKWRDQYLP